VVQVDANVVHNLALFFYLKIDETIFCAMVGFIVMVHAIWRFHCVWALVMPLSMVQSSASLVVLGGSLIESLRFLSHEGPLKFFSQFSGAPQPSESMLCTGFG
jgi:hypothetical protein